MATAAYRPPGWSNGPPMVSITVNGTPPTQSTPVDTGSGADLQMQSFSDTQTPITYVFDAVLELDHEQDLEPTVHPVQTNSAINTHAYLLPARLVLNVLMSDAVDAYYSVGNQANIAPFTGNPSKSVSAYQTLLQLQASRQPLTVVTRLRTYQNMLITRLPAHEDARTITGLRAPVSFIEIRTALATTSAVSGAPDSARPDDTDSTGLGAVAPTAVPSTTQSQFQYPSLIVPATSSSLVNGLINAYNVVNVPGAGLYASEAGQAALSALQGLIP